MAKFFLFFFTVLLSLSLGLFVGQNYFLGSDTLPKQSSNYESEIDLNFGLKEKFNSLMNSIFAREKITSSDSDKKSSVKNSVKNNDSKINEPNAKDSKKYNEELKTLHKEYGVDLETEKVVENKKVEAKKESPKQEGLKITSNESLGSALKGWVIQVGAFQAESDALNLEQKIKELGFPFYYYKADVKGQTWYRVNVGPFPTLPEATQFKQSKKVQAKFKDAFIRQL